MRAVAFVAFDLLLFECHGVSFLLRCVGQVEARLVDVAVAGDLGGGEGAGIPPYRII